MSTRAQIVVKDRDGDEQWFYRHSNGHPEGTMPTLKEFLQWAADGRIRQNVEQAAGWLVVIGAKEYGESSFNEKKSITEPSDGISGWKVGAYEPCADRERHGDIDYFYTVNLGSLKIDVENVRDGTVKSVLVNPSTDKSPTGF